MREKILIGYYTGIGDLTAALPLIKKIEASYDLTLCISEKLKPLVVFFDLNTLKIIYFKKTLSSIFLLKKALKKNFSRIFISPHAIKSHSSFFLPILTFLFKNSDTQVIGAFEQKNSFLFNKRLKIPMNVPIWKRDYLLFRSSKVLDNKINRKEYFLHKSEYVNKSNNVVIHIGAGRNNKRFENSYLYNLINIFRNNASYKIIILGLPKEILEIQQLFKNTKKDNLINFKAESFINSINLMINSKAVITMDSGFGHIASTLGLNHFFICGPTDPKIVSPDLPNTTVIYKENIACQPCNSIHCKYKTNFCLSLLDPMEIFKEVIKSTGGS